MCQPACIRMALMSKRMFNAPAGSSHQPVTRPALEVLPSARKAGADGTASTQKLPTPNTRGLLSDAATLQHCLLPRCAIPELKILARVNRQLRKFVHSEFDARVASLLRALQHAPVGQEKWEGMSCHALLKRLQDAGKPLSTTQRLNLLMTLAREPVTAGQLGTAQRKRLLAFVVQTLKSPGGMLPAMVDVVERLGYMETVLLHLDPVARTAFWQCRAELERDRAQGKLALPLPNCSVVPQHVAAPKAMARPIQRHRQHHRQQHVPALLIRLFRH